jgi:hypothetical protein
MVPRLQEHTFEDTLKDVTESRRVVLAWSGAICNAGAALAALLVARANTPLSHNPWFILCIAISLLAFALLLVTGLPELANWRHESQERSQTQSRSTADTTRTTTSFRTSQRTDCPRPARITSAHVARAVECSPTAEASSEAVRPRARRRSNVAAATVLLAGAFGIGANFFPPPITLDGCLGAGFYLMTIAAAIATLITHRHRNAMTGLLLGLWSLSVPFVAVDVFIATADRVAWGISGKYLIGFYIGVASDVLGVAGAILLWSCCKPYAEKRPRRGFGIRPMLILWSVGLSQFAGLTMWTGTTPRYAATDALGIATLIIGAAVAWYALGLQVIRLGGMIILGWIASTAANLAVNLTGLWSFFTILSKASGVIESILLTTVAIAAILYVRHPTALENSVETPSRPATTTGTVERPETTS